MANALIAQVDEHTERVFKTLFEQAGYQVMVAYNGGEAIYYLSGHDLPDVLLVDFDLPVIPGMDVLKYLKIKYKECDECPLTSVVALTDNEHLVDTPNGKLADVIILKPVSVDGLANLTEQINLLHHIY